MHPVPRRPVHGNWIWLATAVLSATVLAGAALRYAGPHCPAATPGATPRTAAAIAPSSAGGSTAVTVSPAPAASGEAVFYHSGTVVGSCSLGPFPAGGLYVSLPPQQYDGGAACGTYLDVQGPRGRVRAEVVDLCPGCAATSINLDQAAFQRVAGPDAGSATVTYRVAADPLLPGPIVVHVAATVSGRPTVQVVNHGNRLTSVAIAPAVGPGARWQPLTLGPNDFWVLGTGRPASPVALRITDSLGHQVVIPGVSLKPGSTTRSRMTMYRLPAALPGTSTPPAQPAARGHCS